MSKITGHDQKIINDLTHRFMEGEKIAMDDMVTKYFDPKSRLQYIQSQEKMRGIISRLRVILIREHDRIIAPVSRGVFGIPTTQEEYVYAQSMYINRIRGMVALAIDLRDFADSRGLIPATFKIEKLALPEISLGKRKA